MNILILMIFVFCLVLGLDDKFSPETVPGKLGIAFRNVYAAASILASLLLIYQEFTK